MSGEAHPTPQPSRPKDPVAGEMLAGRFRLLRRVGTGGMGDVWVAEQVALGREVAVKLLNASAATRPESAARFELEARALSRVEDDHILRVYDFGRDADRGLFLATELLDGEPLSDVLDREGRLPVARAIDIAHQILEGLGAAHGAGVVHRDLKPSNVMLIRKGARADFAKILDFGIAKVLEGPDRIDLTQAGIVCGTPAFLSPEQAMAMPVDHRADLYSFAVMLFRALSGRLPFEADTPTAMAILHATAPAPRLPGDAGPPELAAVIARALAKDPDDRFESAASMLEAMMRACSMPLPGSSSNPPAIAPSPRSPSAKPAPRPVSRKDVPPTRVEVAPDLAAETSAAVPPARPPSGAFLDPLSREARSSTKALLSVSLRPASGVLSPHPLPTTPVERTMSSLGSTLNVPARGLGTAAHAAREVIEAFGGRVASITSSSVLADFVSPTDTLACAAAVVDQVRRITGDNGSRVEVRAGVSAGEVARAKRVLFGDAVAQAESLSRAARDGDVLFTQAVYLSMTRSEVRCEEEANKSLAIGQRVFRLLPPEKKQPELPFGGNALERLSGAAGSRGLKRSARASGAVLWFVLERAAVALESAVVLAFRASKRRPAIALPIALAVVGLLGLGVARILEGGPRPKIEAALAAGRADDALSEAAAWVLAEPELGEAQLWRGRALAETGRHDEAVEALKAAIAQDPELKTSAALQRALVRALDKDEPEAARELATTFGAALERPLLEGTRSERYYERWNSVRLLEQLGLGHRVDRTSVFLLDLEHGWSCKTRSHAVKQLVEIGDSSSIKKMTEIRSKLSVQKDERPSCSNLAQQIDQAITKLSPR